MMMMMMNSGSTQSEEFINDDSVNSNSEYSISSFFNPSSSSSSTSNTTHHNDHLFWSAGSTSHQTTTFPLPPPPDSDALRAVRKPPQKKRSRVSNRNPTTVLTTDATNFRQMVQQFTGIPANPLSGGPPRSLDLFSSALRPGYQYLDTLYGPIHPLKPSANKVSSSSPLLYPTMIDSLVTTANIVSTTGDPAASASNNNSNNYPPSLSSDHHRFNLQNHSIDPIQLGGNASIGFRAAALISDFQSPSATSQVKDNHNI